MKLKVINDWVVIILLLIVAFCIYLESYTYTHFSFSFFILFLLATRRSLNTKIILFFLFLYYSIPFLDISTYRGIISFPTLKIYTIANFFIILPLLFSFGKKKNLDKEKSKLKIIISPFFIKVVIIHLLIVYLILAYIFLSVGNVLVYQELRFSLNPKIVYFIKSTLYIPLFIIFFQRQQFTKKNILFFIFLPLFPPFFIGSRGTVILIVICIMLLYLLKSFKPGERYYLGNSPIWKKNKKKIYFYGGVVLLFFQIIYYTRRIFSKTLLSNQDLAIKYFGSAEWYYILIMPIYFSLRETVGITNKIINKELENIWFNYPMFFSEMATLLPGKQISPGIALSRAMYETNYSGGITPGIIGALYLDYKFYLYIILFFISFFILYLYRRSLLSDVYKILYVITIAQFFHIYHRGFFKPEYLVSYIIILIYVYISRLKDKSQKPVLTS